MLNVNKLLIVEHKVLARSTIKMVPTTGQHQIVKLMDLAEDVYPTMTVDFWMVVKPQDKVSVTLTLVFAEPNLFAQPTLIASTKTQPSPTVTRMEPVLNVATMVIVVQPMVVKSITKKFAQTTDNASFVTQIKHVQERIVNSMVLVKHVLLNCVVLTLMVLLLFQTVLKPFVELMVSALNHSNVPRMLLVNKTPNKRIVKLTRHVLTVL